MTLVSVRPTARRLRTHAGSLRWRRPGFAAASLGWCLAASLLLSCRMLGSPGSRIVGGGGNDQAQMVWFLAYFPRSVLAGHDPFVTTYIHYPTGVNLMWNAYAPLLGAAASPITLTAGPIVAYNVLLVLAPALTAWSSGLWLRRYAGPAGAAVGGLIAGFSPFLVGQAMVHLDKAFLVFVPVIAMMLEDLIWRRPRPAWRTGIYLGLAIAAAALINEEIVLIAATGVLIALAGGVVFAPRTAPRAYLRAVPGGTAAAVVFALAAGYPLHRQLTGGHGFTGVNAGWWSAQLSDWVLPTPLSLIRFVDRGREFATRRVGYWETGGYLGVLLIVALLVIGIVLRRRLGVRIALFAVAWSMLFSLGSRLKVGRDLVGPHLPWSFFLRLPMLRYVLPIRLSMVTWFAVAFCVAVAVDAAVRRLRGRRRVWALAALGCALVFLVPSTEPAGANAGVPTYFDSAAAKRIPLGSTTMILPLGDIPLLQRPMLWSAVAGMRYRDIGGAAKRTGPHHQSESGPESQPLTAWATTVSRGSRASSAMASLARDWLVANHIEYVLVADDYSPPGTAWQVTTLLGAAPMQQSGAVQVWKVDSAAVRRAQRAS